MTPQLQRYRTAADGAYGDCYRTCLAMVLDMDRDDVPHFGADLKPGTPVDDPRHIACDQAERAWLADHGVVPLLFPFHAEMGLPALADQIMCHNQGGATIIMCSLDGICNHVVVAYGGKLYDPLGHIHPARYMPCVGDGFYWMVVLAKATLPLPADRLAASVAKQEKD